MKTCYIFSAAEGLPKNFKKGKDDIVIAADAGYKHLKKLNIAPDIVVGDFDSLGFIPEGSKIIRHPVKKDDTDTLLAVKTGLENGYKRFVLYGSVGGRLDHTFANVQTLNFIAENGGMGFICGEDFCITSIKNSTISFSSLKGGNLSVFSAFGTAYGVTIKGLLYEVENTVIKADFPIGVSNEFVGKNAEISVKDGTLNIFFDGNFEDIIKE